MTLSRHAEPNGRQRLVREGFRTQSCVSSRLALVPGVEHVAATKSAYYIQTMQPGSGHRSRAWSMRPTRALRWSSPRIVPTRRRAGLRSTFPLRRTLELLRP
jgi:hypothetical protein